MSERRTFYHPASGAAAAGAPFATGGTIVGGLILVLSGLKPGLALLRRSKP